MSEQAAKPIPAPPETITDPDQIALGEDRWQNCPLNDCKRDVDLLYQDFYLRGIRSNRLLCSKCAVRVPTGYMAREEAKKADDRFFQGTQSDNAIVFGVMAAGSAIVNMIMLILSFGVFLFALFLGAGVGAALASFARRLANGRVTRQMPYVAIAGIILGTLIAPSLYILFTGGFLAFVPPWNNFTGIIVTVAMSAGAWGVFLRRI